VATVIRSGDLITVAEQDYKFGTGPLTLRVDTVLHNQLIDGALWIYVRGTATGWRGSAEQRQVLLRASAVEAGRARPA
jgi:hypothetical protein